MTRRPSQSSDEARGRSLLALVALAEKARLLIADLKVAGADPGPWVDILTAAEDGRLELERDAITRLVLASINPHAALSPAQSRAVADLLA